MFPNRFIAVVLLLLANVICISTRSLSTFTSKSKLEGLEPCTNDKDCSRFKNATCSEGFCACENYELNICEEISYTVTNKIEGKCEESQNCNANNSECSADKKCVCKEGFIASSDRRRCLEISSLGDTCEENIQCSTKITSSVCRHNQCVCQNNTHQYRGLCLKNAVLGERCLQDEQCSVTASSSCIDSKCSCIETHVAINLKCLQIAQDIGDDCEDDIQCVTTFGGGAYCSQNICQCRDLYQFKAINSTCVRDILLNEMCSIQSDCQGGTNRLMCVSGVCKCKPEFRETHGYCSEYNESSSSIQSNPLLSIVVLLIISICLNFIVF